MPKRNSNRKIYPNQLYSHELAIEAFRDMFWAMNNYDDDDKYDTVAEQETPATEDNV